MNKSFFIAALIVLLSFVGFSDHAEAAKIRFDFRGDGFRVTNRDYHDRGHYYHGGSYYYQRPYYNYPHRGYRQQYYYRYDPYYRHSPYSRYHRGSNQRFDDFQIHFYGKKRHKRH